MVPPTNPALALEDAGSRLPHSLFFWSRSKQQWAGEMPQEMVVLASIISCFGKWYIPNTIQKTIRMRVIRKECNGRTSAPVRQQDASCSVGYASRHKERDHVSPCTGTYWGEAVCTGILGRQNPIHSCHRNRKARLEFLYVVPEASERPSPSSLVLSASAYTKC